jgi:hypothetical protein
MLIRLEEANDGKHKYIAYFSNGRKTRFGAKGYEDYTMHNDVKRREAYRKRHAKDLNTNDPYRAGYLSFYILWNLPTIEASVKDYNKRFFSK